MSDVSGLNSSRRKFIKKMVYVPSVILTLNAVPSYATTGSQRYSEDDKGSHYSGGNNYSSHEHRRWHGWSRRNHHHH